MAVPKSGAQFHEDQTMREGEAFRLWYRSDRVFLRNNEWYIQTREGIEVGPYACEFDATVEAATLIKKLQEATGDDSERIVLTHKNLAGSQTDLTSESYTDYVEEVGIDPELQKIVERFRTARASSEE